MEPIRVDEEEGEEIIDLFEAGKRILVKDGAFTLTCVTVQRYVESHRWADTHWLIFHDEGENLWALPFDSPSTEMQEDQGYWEYTAPEFFPVKEKQITSYVKA